MATDKDLSTKVERPGRVLEARPFLKNLAEEITSFERTASPETVARLNRTSRRLSSIQRIPEARHVLGPAADVVFFENSSRGPRRSVANVQQFISLIFLH